MNRKDIFFIFSLILWRKYQFATYLRKFYAKNVHKNSVILGNLVQAVLALLVTFSMYAVMLLYDFLKKIYIITLNSAKKFKDHLFVFNTRNPKNVVKLLRVMLSWLAVELLRVCLCLKKMRPPGSSISPAWPMNCIEYRTPTESLLQSWWWYIFLNIRKLAEMLDSMKWSSNCFEPYIMVTITTHIWITTSDVPTKLHE